MVRKEEIRSVALLMSLGILTWSVVTMVYPEMIDFIVSGNIIYGFLLPLIHGNIFHALLNVWCFLSIVFNWRLKPMDLLWSYIVSSIILYYIGGVIGLSGMLFFIFGEFNLLSRNKRNYLLLMSVSLAIGFIIPNVSGMAHLACYVSGVIFCLFTFPVRWLRRN